MSRLGDAYNEAEKTVEEKEGQKPALTRVRFSRYAILSALSCLPFPFFRVFFSVRR